MKKSNLIAFFVTPAALTAAASLNRRAIVHPGLLHTEADFERIRSKVDSGAEPWATGLEKLVARADASYEPDPQEQVCRGTNGPCDENYSSLYRDIHAAYANAVYWKITDNTTHADAAVKIVDAWSSTMTELNGTTDVALAAGIYGYQFANVAELLRTYDAWEGLDAITTLLRDVFFEISHDFLVRHFDAEDDHYWANVSSNHSIEDQNLTWHAVGSMQPRTCPCSWCPV